MREITTRGKTLAHEVNLYIAKHLSVRPTEKLYWSWIKTRDFPWLLSATLWRNHTHIIFCFRQDTRYTEPRIEDRGSITNLMNRPASRVIFTFPSLVLRSRQTVGKYSVSTFIARFKADFTLNYAWKWHPLISICNSLESRKKEFRRLTKLWKQFIPIVLIPFLIYTANREGSNRFQIRSESDNHKLGTDIQTTLNWTFFRWKEQNLEYALCSQSCVSSML